MRRRGATTADDGGVRGRPAGTRLLLVGPAGSYRLGDHLTAAHELGCEVTVVTDAPIAIPGSAIVTSLSDPARAASAVLAACDGPFDGVVGTDGPAVRVAGELARRLGLPANPPTALRTAEDKLAQRRALAAAGVPQPAFAVDSGTTRAARPLPAVVKPVDRTASQGVLLATTPAELEAAVARVRRLIGPDAPVLVERFVPGAEVAVDALLRDGRMQVLTIFDKPDTPTGPTFPETLLISPGRLRPATRAAVCEVVERAVGAVGLTEGPVHAECRVDDDGVWVLELAARSIGGLCSRSVRVAGLRIEELVVRHALGLDVPAGRATDATGVLMLPVPAAGRLVAVHGVDAARGVDGVADVVITVRPDEPVTPLPDGDRYLGFVFARAATPDDCERALRTAWAALRVEIDDGGGTAGR